MNRHGAKEKAQEMEDAAIERLWRNDNRNVHPWESMRAYGRQQRTVISAGKGIYVWDQFGNRLIDAPAGMWCVNIGHGRREIADAIADQIGRISYASPWSLTNEPAALLVEKIVELSPGDLNNVFFCTGGSTAVDSALRFVAFLNNLKGRPEKKHIIARERGYHGSTHLSASVSGRKREKQHFDFVEDIVHFVSCPHSSEVREGNSEADYAASKAAELERKIVEIGAERVAAFIAEPIMGAGGVIVPPAGYHKLCFDICRRHDVLYIMDEVVTGFGRLGSHFASEEVFGIIPDMIATAKGLTSGYVPMGALLISDRLIGEIRESLSEDALFMNGFTYSGHPVACAAALRNLEILDQEDLLANARRMGVLFQEQLQGLREISIVKDVRGMGLMAAVECSIKDTVDLDLDRRIGTQVDSECQKRGLLIRPLLNMCVMSPPLIIDEEQITDLVDRLREALLAAERSSRDW